MNNALTNQPIASLPVLNQLNLVVKNMAASIAFYRLLGIAIEPAAHPGWRAHHATAIMPNGMRLELDSESFVKQWNVGWQTARAGANGVIFFYVGTRNEVDRLYAEITHAGYESQQYPLDAFWGARYAIVLDPDKNPVGIMSPIEPDRRSVPPPPPSD